MDGQRSRSGQGKERMNGVNHFRGQYKQRSRNYRRGTHQNGNNFTESRGRNSTPYRPRIQPVPEASTSSSCVDSDTKVLDIPGFFYDPVKKRYFKEKQGQPIHFVIQNDNRSETTTTTLASKVISRLHYVQKREMSILQNNKHFRRRGLEDWARNIVERKSLGLSDTHPCPAFKGSMCSMALSKHCGKLVTIEKLPGLGCNTIHIYDINDDKEMFIRPHMLATIIASEVTHVEWNPRKSMKNFFFFHIPQGFLDFALRLNLFGSEDSKGSAVVCKFDESLQSCELNSYPLQNGTAWHCSWSGNPQFSTLLGIAGSKQAVLVDSVEKSLVCKIRSSSDVFCIEFGQKSPVAYLGCRNGNIMCVDIRVKNAKQSKPFNVGGKVKSSATCLKVMHDENYLMASSINGMIKLWDVRLSKSVKEYHGNVNETKLIPFIIDSSENIMTSAGDDGNTRIWSIQTCELLNTINLTENTNGEINIPAVCLGENWTQRDNMVALALGIEDKLKLYF